MLLSKKDVKGKGQNKSIVDDSSSFLDPTWMKEKGDTKIGNVEMRKLFKSNPFKSESNGG